MRPSGILQDVRYALRGLVRSPGFSLAAVATLALGIGANAAIFSLVRGVLLRPLPFPKPDALVSIWESNDAKGYARMVASPPNYVDWKAQSRSFESMGAFVETTLAASEGGRAERLDGAAVTSGFFETLGTRPLYGRVFRESEIRKGGPGVVVLGHGAWARRFGADPDIVGRTVRLDGESYEVIGVMPASFRFPEEAPDFWVPLAFGPEVATQRGAHYLDVIARLRPGATAAAAHAEIRAIADRLRAAYPRSNSGYTAGVTRLDASLVENVAPTLKILLGAVALVTLIACANVANLLLARGTRRRPEIAIRTALGAGRGRIARQLLTESAVLAAAGASAGLALAAACLDSIVRLAPASVPRLSEVRLDGGVLAFTAAWTIASVVIFGLAPALAAVRPRTMQALRGHGADAGVSPRRVSTRQALVVGQVALALVLSAGAGLLLRSLARLSAVDPGFRTEGSLTYALTLPASRYPNESARGAFLDRLLERMRALPGSRSAGAVFGLPLTGMSFSSSFRESGAADDGREPSAQLRLASRGYFTTMGIPVVAGRGFTDADRPGAPIAILVSESAAKKFFPRGDAIGKRLRFGARPSETRVEGEVVGVVGDVRDAELGAGPTPEFYGSLEQIPTDEFHVVVRAGVPAETLAAAARAAVAGLDPELAVTDLSTLDEVVRRSVARPRFLVQLLLVFASLALLLCAIGVYGVTAYGVSRRTREIGIRMALGADRAAIRAMVVREAARLAAAGVALGVAGAFAATRLLRGLLFEIAPGDPVTHATVALLLAAVAFAASALPARRAARMDPLAALRTE
ncbi:MAG TPA: ABC transporter permease [Thermoanaerobaculia bacterium]|jgi:predicted permease|nr:ABC transporter permease [Thermoanaerobaculia bacterium]